MLIYAQMDFCHPSSIELEHCALVQKIPAVRVELLKKNVRFSTKTDTFFDRSTLTACIFGTTETSETLCNKKDVTNFCHILPIIIHTLFTSSHTFHPTYPPNCSYFVEQALNTQLSNVDK